jgi:ParB-like chromosome segregation protein Spo0J
MPKRTRRNLSYINKALRRLAVPIADLKFDKENARRHSRRNLDVTKHSLKKTGQAKCIVVWKRGDELIVIAGNGTISMALELGWTHVAANVREFETEEDAREFAFNDNRSGELAEWDGDVLPKQLNELKVAGVDLEAMGWTDVEIEDFAKKPTRVGRSPNTRDPEAQPPGMVTRSIRLPRGLLEELEAIAKRETDKQPVDRTKVLWADVAREYLRDGIAHAK